MLTQRAGRRGGTHRAHELKHARACAAARVVLHSEQHPRSVYPPLPPGRGRAPRTARASTHCFDSQQPVSSVFHHVWPFACMHCGRARRTRLCCDGALQSRALAHCGPGHNVRPQIAWHAPITRAAGCMCICFIVARGAWCVVRGARCAHGDLFECAGVVKRAVPARRRTSPSS